MYDKISASNKVVLDGLFFMKSVRAPVAAIPPLFPRWRAGNGLAGRRFYVLNFTHNKGKQFL